MHLKELIQYAEIMSANAKDLYACGNKGEAAMRLSKFAVVVERSITSSESFASYTEERPETKTHSRRNNT